MPLTRADMERLARQQHEARVYNDPIPTADWDLTGADLTGAVLRAIAMPGATMPQSILTGAFLTGADLTGANLREADLRYATLRYATLREADLREADLRGAELADTDLRDAKVVGARIAEGTITHATAGRNSRYCWHALRVEDGTIILQYGCDRATLTKWRTRGPEYGARYEHTISHWDTGPAIAITAAEQLAA